MLLAVQQQQRLSFVVVVELEKALEQLILIEILDETFRIVNEIEIVLNFLFALLNFEFLIVHRLAQLEPETILALLALNLTDVLVLVVGQIGQQAADEDPEEFIVLLDRISFQVQRAKPLEKSKAFELIFVPLLMLNERGGDFDER